MLHKITSRYLRSVLSFLKVEILKFNKYSESLSNLNRICGMVYGGKLDEKLHLRPIFPLLIFKFHLPTP
jgi:hypothetical protein